LSVKDQSSRQTFAWSLAIVVGGAGFYLAQTQRGYGVFGAFAVALAAFFVFGYVLSRIARRRAKTVAGEVAKDKAVELPKAAADDLQLIKGVGPGLEKQLHDLGVFQFNQIAAWEQDAAGKVDGNTDSKRATLISRAKRENWGAQAQSLVLGEKNAA